MTSGNAASLRLWAEEWGRDEYGAWVTFRVGEVVQRMRWIPPGRFWMGSPDDEEGRYPDEGPATRRLSRVVSGCLTPLARRRSGKQ